MSHKFQSTHSTLHMQSKRENKKILSGMYQLKFNWYKLYRLYHHSGIQHISTKSHFFLRHYLAENAPTLMGKCACTT